MCCSRPLALTFQSTSITPTPSFSHLWLLTSAPCSYAPCTVQTYRATGINENFQVSTVHICERGNAPLASALFVPQQRCLLARIQSLHKTAVLRMQDAVAEDAVLGASHADAETGTAACPTDANLLQSRREGRFVANSHAIPYSGVASASRSCRMALALVAHRYLDGGGSPGLCIWIPS